MTQRNEEWAKVIREHDDGSTCPMCPHRMTLVMEVIDESVRVLPEVLEGIKGNVTSGVHHSEAVTMTYREVVALIHAAGYRPVDLNSREPIMNWKPRAPETKARQR